MRWENRNRKRYKKMTLGHENLDVCRLANRIDFDTDSDFDPEEAKSQHADAMGAHSLLQ